MYVVLAEGLCEGTPDCLEISSCWRNVIWVVLKIRAPFLSPFYEGAVLYWGPKKGP